MTVLQAPYQQIAACATSTTRHTCNSFISSFSLFTGSIFTSSTNVSTRFMPASIDAVANAPSRLGPNSFPSGLRGPTVGISLDVDGMIVGSGAWRGRGERRGEDVGEMGETALRVRVRLRLVLLRGESERLVVRRICESAVGVREPERRKGGWRPVLELVLGSARCSRDCDVRMTGGADEGSSGAGMVVVVVWWW